MIQAMYLLGGMWGEVTMRTPTEEFITHLLEAVQPIPIQQAIEIQLLAQMLCISILLALPILLMDITLSTLILQVITIPH